MRRAWPLVGRDAELASVRGALADGRGAVLSGPAGVGKSRLLAEAVALASGPDTVAVTVRASRSAAALPLGAFAPVLDPGRPSHSLATARQDLLARAGGGRLVLAIDDVHMLDDSSAALVHQLAADGEVSLLATARLGDSPPAAVVALWKDELCERVDVAALSREDVGRLL